MSVAHTSGTTDKITFDLVHLEQRSRPTGKTRRAMHETKREILKKLARRMRREHSLCS